MNIKNKKISIILIVIIPFLMGLGVDMYVPSLPKIATYFSASTTFVQWTVGIYMLGYGIGQLILGPISDWKGRKIVLLFSAFFFSLFSASVLLIPNILFLNVLRFLQGITIAGLAVSIRAVLADEFSGIELKKVSNYLSLSWSVGPIIGPFIGSLLQKHFGWKSNFYIFCLYGLIIFIITFLHFKESNKNMQKLNIKDTTNCINTMLTYRKFIFIVLISTIMYAIIITFNMVGPFIIEKTLNKSISFYGNIAMLLGTAYFLGVLLNRYLINFIKGKTLILIGLLLNFIIIILALAIELFITSLPLMIIFIYFIFLFIGLIVPNSISISMNIFKDRNGLASSVFGVVNGTFIFLISNIISYLNIKTSLNLYSVYIILILLALILRINLLKKSPKLLKI